MSQQLPSVGRVVHYHWTDGFAAAIITHVYEDESCDLKIFFGPKRDCLLGDERHAVKETPNHYGIWWAWPPYIPPKAREVVDGA